MNRFIYQQGQALLYGILMLLIGLAALFFLFNTGQLSQEKTKLVSTADAVAYSAGVMHARTLNYMAYTNRAMIANTVAISQLVSLSSWVQYTDSLSKRAGAVGLDKIKYPRFYIPYITAVAAGPYLKTGMVDTPTLEGIAIITDGITKSLSIAQSASLALLMQSRKTVMQDIANANYQNRGTIIVDDIPLLDESLNFVKHYKDDERTRFAEVVSTAANQDRFVNNRSWSMQAAIPSYRCLFMSFDRLERTGQTRLLGFNEWQANDKLSEFQRYKSGGLFGRCKTREILNGIGNQKATDSDIPSGFSSSRNWNYSGLPSFYDLSPQMLNQDNPTLKFAIRVRRSINQTTTSEGQSQIKSPANSSLHLNEFKASPAGKNELVAVSSSEVFFERPPSHEDNKFGTSIGKSQELASLFNPYWQVRLIHSEQAIKTAQALQGIVLP